MSGVDPSTFVTAMTCHWEAMLGNVSSPLLQAVWSQMAWTFNRQIANHGTPEGSRWKVLQPATGTGKSQGVALYASMLPLEGHPGVLIVTRLKTQADELAETVNALAGADIAFAYHSDSRADLETIRVKPVLVITHRAFEIGLDAINRGHPERSNWEAFTTWGFAGRKLVVIDEALDIIEDAQVTLDDVRLLRSLLPTDPDGLFTAERRAVEVVETHLARVAEAGDEGPQTEHVLWDATDRPLERIDLTPLREALRGRRLDHLLTARHDDAENARHRERFDNILKAIQTILNGWAWYNRKLGDHTLNAARLIVPEEAPGAVVLDATATSNLIYGLFDHRADVIPVPSVARRYDNVTLHVSRGHKVGKRSLTKNAKTEAGELAAALSTQLPTDRSVFVCCHRHVETHLVAFDPGFRDFQVGHWGAIDGRNTWGNFDTAVIFGLPYRDTIWPANTFMALQGLQSTEWLVADGNRPFGEHRDIRAALQTGQLVVSIVQAINRVRCRRVVDDEGNCETTDVFLLLPAGSTGVDILEGIKREMPGIKITPWSYQAARRKPKRSNWEEAVVSYAATMMPGRKAAKTVREDLGIPRSCWERLVAKLKDATTDISRRLTEHGVTYALEGAGRRQSAYLIRRAEL